MVEVGMNALGMNGTGGGKFGSPFVHPLPISHIV